MKNILICNEAIRDIIREASICPVETGGILIGLVNPPTVIFAGGPGKNAIKESVRFTGDVEEDRINLKNARKEFGDSLGIVGYWHKHPRGMKTYSTQDLHQARKLSASFKDGKPLLILIIAKGLKRPGLGLYPYVLNHPEENLERWAVKVVNRNDLCIQELLKTAPILPEVQKGGFWDKPDFQCFQNPVGKSYLQNEMKKLKARGWRVVLGRDKLTGRLKGVFSRNDQTLYGWLPREFPLNPPRIFTEDRQELIGLTTLVQWSSMYSLSDVLDESIMVLDCPRCRHRYLHNSREENSNEKAKKQKQVADNTICQK